MTHCYDDDTYAVMVHKLYSERVQKYLLTSESKSDPQQQQHPSWVVVSAHSPQPPSSSFPPTDDHGRRVTVLDTPLISGVSQARRGYVLLLIHASGDPEDSANEGSGHESTTGRRTSNTTNNRNNNSSSCCSTTRFDRLPAMARQNISWVGRITNSTSIQTITGGSSEIETVRDHDGTDAVPTGTSTTTIGSVIWNMSSLRNLYRKLRQNLVLRVDCHPRDRIPDICRQLQHCAMLDDQQQQQQEQPGISNSNSQTDRTDVDDDDPFEGPIAMTVSRSKCTHRLTVIVLPQPNSSKRRAHEKNTNLGTTTTDETATINSRTCSSSSNNSENSSIRTNEMIDAAAVSSTIYYWGLEDRSVPNDCTIMQLKLNHEAADDVVVVPADTKGRDTVSSSAPIGGVGNGVVSSTTPLSRAYYKLHQVWHDYLATDSCWEATTLAQSSVVPPRRRRRRHGLDLGASPGGWTQVLVHCFGCTKVVAVDAGIVAQRALHPFVQQQQQQQQRLSSSGGYCNRSNNGEASDLDYPVADVCHVQSSMEQADLTSPEPYTVLVCDASLGWTALLDLMVMTAAKCSWTCPAVVVITLKMPFKTAGSIQRHVQDMHEKIPNFLLGLQRAMFPTSTLSSSAVKTNRRVRTRHQLVHLMANADSERTLIAILEWDSKQTPI